MTSDVKRIARGITARYLIALCLIAGLTTAAYVTLNTAIHAEQHRAAVISLAANQETLSQRIAFFANAFASADNELDRDDYHRELRRATKAMARAHEKLALNASDFGLSDDMIRTLNDIYFDGANPFDTQVRSYLENAEKILDLPASALSPDNVNLITLNLAGTNYIMQTHELIVTVLQRDGEMAIASLERLETVIWVTALLLLLIEATFIFRPMARSVTRTVADLDEARIAANAASEAKTAFLRNMSHELRTPMNGIIGMTELLRQTELDPKQTEYTEHLRDAGNHLLTLLNDILDLNRLEAGKVTLEREPFDLRSEIEGCVAMLGPAAQLKGLDVSFDYGSRLPQVFEGDGVRLRQVVLNFLGNAIKFTETGGVEIAVRGAELPTGPSGPSGPVRMRIEVRDTGIGIPDDKQHLIFGEFEQADSSTTRKFGGSGLGLSICKRIVDLMEGRIGVESAVGTGSTFWIEVPLTPTRSDLVPAGKPSDPPLPSVPAGIRVLVAEDNAANRLVIEGLLEDLGALTRLVPNGAEAVEAVETGRFDLVLMDVGMPVLDGVGATQAIRESGHPHAAIPIVALTAHAMPGDAEHLIAQGMSDYLAKPVQKGALARVLSRWAPDVLRKPAKPRTPSTQDAADRLPELLDAETFDGLAEALGQHKMRAVIDAALPAFHDAQRRLEEAIHRANPRQGGEAAHEIRGSASTLGAERLAALARDLESAFQNGGAAPDRADALARTIAETRDALEKRLAS